MNIINLTYFSFSAEHSSCVDHCTKPDCSSNNWLFFQSWCKCRTQAWQLTKEGFPKKKNKNSSFSWLPTTPLLVHFPIVRSSMISMLKIIMGLELQCTSHRWISDMFLWHYIIYQFTGGGRCWMIRTGQNIWRMDRTWWFTIANTSLSLSQLPNTSHQHQPQSSENLSHCHITQRQL